MSLLNAKRIADLTEQVEAESKKMAAKHQMFRARISEDVVGGFTDYLQSNGFEVAKTNTGSKAAYKGLTVELVLPEANEAYIGMYHSFKILVDGKEKFVRVNAKFKGDSSERPALNADKIQSLEFQLVQLEKGLNDLELESYKFDCAQPIRNQRVKPVLKENISEVLDCLLA
ncbi:hypothetical protein [Pseudomonas chlororaphis]|uniref:hypothetical protein n=1 Tax=Pseudomonas chlororaphis TaxID=587753 RepID=UPI002367D905|nr:hypothetical protein [Pseudomonas chlororaphis]WDH37416.1 hypothetical protein PUP62_11510 [Pseudomonas chlororaphis]WDH43503.1 hypothetical protein PUP51_11515 [Pseudomonas chlororaphis]